MKTSCVLVILLSLALAASGCELGDFPIQQIFKVVTYVDYLVWHTGDDGTPAWKGTFHIQLRNATECRYIGIWPESENAPFVGFYDFASKTLRGSWAMFSGNDWFGYIDYVWNGKTLEGYWSGYPDVLGYDILSLKYATRSKRSDDYKNVRQL